MCAWEPILVGDPATRANSLVEQIAVALDGVDPADMSLGDGDVGIALFHSYRGDHDRATSHLERAGKVLEARALPPSLFHGYTGLAWVLHHLAQQFPSEYDADACDVLDEILAEDIALIHPLNELLHGLAGFGLYALERIPSTSAIVDDVVDRLAATAIEMPEGLTWPWINHGDHINLGVAHGIPAILGFLARCAGSGHARATGLFDRGIAWLLSQRDRDGVSSFRADTAGGETGACRLAWCYGDAGIAATLHGMGTVTARTDLCEVAIDIARRATTRVHDAGVIEPWFCHGASGLAHLFARLYRASGDAVLLAGARHWYDVAMPMIDPSRAAPGLLVGLAGAGLVLHAATSEVDPAWDRVLLASAP